MENGQRTDASQRTASGIRVPGPISACKFQSASRLTGTEGRETLTESQVDNDCLRPKEGVHIAVVIHKVRVWLAEGANVDAAGAVCDGAGHRRIISSPEPQVDVLGCALHDVPVKKIILALPSSETTLRKDELTSHRRRRSKQGRSC